MTKNSGALSDASLLCVFSDTVITCVTQKGHINAAGYFTPRFLTDGIKTELVCQSLYLPSVGSDCKSAKYFSRLGKS